VKVNQICSGKKNVAKDQGGAMTVTLRYASQSGVLTFAPITTSLSALPIPTPTETSTTSTTSTSSSTSSFTETTLITATSTRSSATITTTTPHSSQTTISTSSATSTPEAPAAATSSPPPFSKGQIAGISIGALCLAAGVAFGLILLVRFLLRRRRRRHSGSTIGSFIGGGAPGAGGGGAGYMTARDTWGYGFDKTSNSNGSSSASWATREAPGMSRYPAMPAAATAPASNSSSSSSHTKQQQRQQQQHHHHQPYNRESWRPSAIGLAISPSKLFANKKTPTPASTPTRPRPLSKLLPAKPDMTPANATKIGLSPPPPPAATFQETRGDQAPQQQPFLHPIAAQFIRPAAARPTSLRLVIPDSRPLPPPPPPPPAPDKELHLQRQPILGRESTLTEFEEDDLHRSASTAIGQIWRPPSLLPESAVAAPYYVADGSGNWVLGDARKSMTAAAGKGTMRPQSLEPESAVSAPRIATARSGIVTTAVQTHITVPRRSPAMLPYRDETVCAKDTQQQQQQHGNNEPQELEASPSLPLIPDKQRSAKQETIQPGAAAMTPPKTPRIRSVVHTPKTVPSPLFSRQPNPRSASQPLPTTSASASTSKGRLLTVRPAPARVTSDDSGVTTFSVSSAMPDDMPPPLPAPSNRNLSPVAESPVGRAASRAAVQEPSTSNAAVHQLPATVAASDHSRSHSDDDGGGASPVSYPRITGCCTPAPRDHAVLPGSSALPPPPRMALLSSQPSPTLGSVTTPHQGHANGASFQRQPLPSSTYHGALEAARGDMARGRGRGGPMMMMRPPPSDMLRDPTTLLPPPQIPQHPRTGSPTMRIVEPSPEPDPAHPTTTTTAAPPRDDRCLLPSASITTRPPRRRPPSHLPHPFPMYPLRRNPPPPQQHQPDPAPSLCTAPFSSSSSSPPPSPSPRHRGDKNNNNSSSRSSLSRYPGHPMPIPQPYKPRASPSPSPRAALLRSDYDPAAHDNSSQEALADTSSSSSLLAKRLGSTRAADMALPTQRNRERERRWQQQQQQQAGEGRTQKRTQDTEYLATPELPSTPTWVPRLTPTRRGEDLVLNVG
ncbi:hypothetical protein MY11210_008801, partial [Beauveria gryllotalpidicola]